MTTVYLLTTGTDYEGECPRGVFSSFEKAVEESKNITFDNSYGDDVNIYAIDVDYDYDYDPPCIWCKRLRTGKMLIGKDSNES